MWPKFVKNKDVKSLLDVQNNTRTYLLARLYYSQVAPITLGKISAVKSYMLSDCYKSVLKLADDHQLESLCYLLYRHWTIRISQEEAADIAIQTVKTTQKSNLN